MNSNKLTLVIANPFFETWNTPFGLPPFEAILPEHFDPAFTAALTAHEAEIAAIAANPAAPTFQNTMDAFELAGSSLTRVGGVFWNLTGAHTNEAIAKIERDLSPRLAGHFSAIYMNAALFSRVDRLHKDRLALNLDSEQIRLLELTWQNFIRAGAALKPKQKTRLAEITRRLATLGTDFRQNILADEKAYALILKSDAELEGLPDFLRSSMASAARDRNLADGYAVTLSRSIIEPFLTFSARADLRAQAFHAWTHRGENTGANNNLPLIAEILQLRTEMAQLLGHKSFAAYKLEMEMAKTPASAKALLDNIWPRARAKAMRERDDLQALATAEGFNAAIGAQDWRYYSEKLREQRHNFDEATLKPYMQLDHLVEAAFYTANQLFGLQFVELQDVPRYHPDIRIWEVKNKNGGHKGIFIGDYFNRSSKNSGGWMSSYRDQKNLGGVQRPIIVNVMNFAKGEAGKPTLLSMDDARTLFHEFGHGLHGLLSNVTYPGLSGTNVARDFVEFPSQLYEHWVLQPQILRKFALHAETGEPMPEALLQKVLAARAFNQGFLTVEYTSCALVDLAFHALETKDRTDPLAFEKAELERIGMPSEIVMRHRTPHFAHVFAGDGYAAGYYSYIWSEVLDADGFDAFTDAGDIFDPATAERLGDFVYAAGNSRDPVAAYVGFRGRMPEMEPLLEKRGLI